MRPHLINMAGAWDVLQVDHIAAVPGIILRGHVGWPSVRRDEAQAAEDAQHLLYQPVLCNLFFPA